MRRKIFIIGVACLMVVLASMAVNAQDQQRKVTPVKPSTNKVLTPPKGTDENTLDNPEKIIPRPGTCKVDAGKGASLLLDDIPALSFRLYKVKK